MSPVKSRSRSTQYRALKKLRERNAELYNRINKIKKTTASQRKVHPPSASVAAPTQTNVASTSSTALPSGNDHLHAIFDTITQLGLKKSSLPDILELTKLLMDRTVVNNKDYGHLQSVYKLNKALELQRAKHCDTEEDVVFHHFCEECERLFSEGEEICSFCEHPRFDDKGKPLASFMEMNPATQIQDFFRDKCFLDGIAHRFKREVSEDIRDVYDGELYQSLFKNGGFLSHPHNLSLFWHLDGVSIFKSSSMQAWPFQSTICELPPHMRFSKKNVIVHGLWFGKNKPTMSTFLEPIFKTLNELRSEGIKVEPYGSTAASTCKVTALGGTMDLPAAAAVKEQHQWNGSHGCTMCEEPGEGVSTGKRGGHCMAYLYPVHGFVTRTHERIWNQSAENLDTGKVVCGVKGRSELFLLQGFSVSEGILVDYLHGLCLGVMKRMFSCWFDKKGEDFYIGGSLPLINKRLAAIKTPSPIHRPPRSLTERVHFKASEYRSWLLYYGLHVLKDILPNEYFIHFGMLVRAVHILLSDKISRAELQEARLLLKKWYFLVESYYGADQCTINVHNTGLHLVRCVELGGPLWAFSCFFFESMCGDLARMVKGTQQVPKQILSGIRVSQYLRRTRPASDHPSVNYMMKRDKRKTVALCDGFRRIGRVTKWKRNKKGKKIQAERAAVKLMDSRLASAPGVQFEKVERKGEVYHTDKKLKNRANHYVVYRCGMSVRCGAISTFLSVAGSAGEVHVAVIKQLALDDSQLMESVPQDLMADHMVSKKSLLANFNHGYFARSESEQLVAVPLGNILQPFIFLPTSVHEGECVFMPTVFEHD